MRSSKCKDKTSMPIFFQTEKIPGLCTCILHGSALSENNCVNGKYIFVLKAENTVNTYMYCSIELSQSSDTLLLNSEFIIEGMP